MEVPSRLSNFHQNQNAVYFYIDFERTDKKKFKLYDIDHDFNNDDCGGGGIWNFAIIRIFSKGDI